MTLKPKDEVKAVNLLDDSIMYYGILIDCYTESNIVWWNLTVTSVVESRVKKGMVHTASAHNLRVLTPLERVLK